MYKYTIELNERALDTCNNQINRFDIIGINDIIRFIMFNIRKRLH